MTSSSSSLFDLFSNKSRAIFDISAKDGVTNESVVVEVLRCKREKAKKNDSLENLESAFEYVKKIVDRKDIHLTYKSYKQLYYVLEDYAVQLYRNDDYTRSAKLLGFSLLLQLNYLNQNPSKDDWKAYSRIEEIIDSFTEDFFIDAIQHVAFTEDLLEQAKEQGLYHALGGVLLSLKIVYGKINAYKKWPFTDIEWNAKKKEYHFKEYGVLALPAEVNLEMGYCTYDREEEILTVYPEFN